jgi:hypothetical protein
MTIFPFVGIITNFELSIFHLESSIHIRNIFSQTGK